MTRSRLIAALLVASAACSKDAVEPITVSSVTVTPATAQLASGAQLQFQAQVTGSNGATLTDRTIVWSSSDPALAQVTNTGLVTGGQNRAATSTAISITASAEGVSGTAALDLEPVPATAVRLSADSVMLLVGDSLSLTARIVGAGDVELSGRDIVWSSLDTTVARVSSVGVVSIVDDGGARFRTTEIIARSQDVADTAKIVARPQPPAVQLAVADTFIRVGNGTRIEWESERAITCTGTGALDGADGVGGSLDYRPTEGGRPWARLECVGDGGSSGDSVQIVTPLPVLPSSYENYREYFMAPIESPFYLVPPVCERSSRDDGYGRGPGNARAYADFLQNGTLVLADAVGKTVCFWQRTDEGEWVEITDLLLREGDTGRCEGNATYPSGDANKGLVADYNGDLAPDVFFTCYPGISFWLLSGADGRYFSQMMTNTAQPHGASAGDIDGDSDVDILFPNDQWEQRAVPTDIDTGLTILLNDGTGNFTRRDDLVVLPDTFMTGTVPPVFPMWSFTAIELIDLDEDGHLDAVMGNGQYPTTIFWGQAVGGFQHARAPIRLDWTEPEIPHNGVHTFHKVGNYLYSWSIWHDDSPGNLLQRTDLDTWHTETVWERREGYGTCSCVEGGPNRSFGQVRFDRRKGKFILDWVLGLEIDP